MVEGARSEAGPDTELVAQALLRRLRAFQPNAIERFQELWEQAQDELYRWPVLDAATLLLGRLTDELAVQDWILSYDRQTMRGVLEDPDSLVHLASNRHNTQIDWFCSLPMEAHIGATGAPFAVDGPQGPDEPYGTRTDLTNEVVVRRHFPRLAAYIDDNRWIPRPWEPHPADQTFLTAANPDAPRAGWEDHRRCGLCARGIGVSGSGASEHLGGAQAASAPRPVHPNHGKPVTGVEFESAVWLVEISIWSTGEADLSTVA
jgi:hypothetical protein